jgi:hypothetical protein
MFSANYVLIVRATEPGQICHGFAFSAPSDELAISHRPAGINVQAPDGRQQEYNVLDLSHEIWRVYPDHTMRLIFEQEAKK